jgi:hypothetical protein
MSYPPVIVQPPAVEGETPAPPPITILLAPNTPLDAIVFDALKYGMPPLVPEVMPVPPFPTPSVFVTPVVSGRPVAFVNTPLEGVPSAPPLTTTDPADPTLTPSAVTTPVPVVMPEGHTPAPPPTIS